MPSEVLADTLAARPLLVKVWFFFIFGLDLKYAKTLLFVSVNKRVMTIIEARYKETLHVRRTYTKCDLRGG